MPPVSDGLQYAYAVKRFDREGQKRIHIEDFAQAFGVRSHEKYSATNYESMVRLLKITSANPLADIAEFIRRITFNILIANTDAHLKNFSLIYPDGIVPRLAPAYDLVTSLGYINNTELALNFARYKNFYQINAKVIQKFSKRIEMPNDFVMQTIGELVEKAADRWPKAIKGLPVPKKQHDLLKIHWKNLQKPFQLKM